jgi:hypothetical protein
MFPAGNVLVTGGSLGVNTLYPLTSLHVYGNTGISSSIVRASIIQATGSFGMSGSLRLGAETSVSAALSNPRIHGWMKLSCPGFPLDPCWIAIYTGSI